ncbi:DUF2199 domain-containing protein [Noviherbaspirillum sp. CPCC 100848]|uniref:DUF2199 domain-containing protein n=1 Tax=Noviherbaspirillum album TaxID=3080276 RepID=A0ABU6J2Z4_9BURK|nr:DUF2199 domain-containing protein [Noviherbaspirillum sp. CPCC 100848]MEC4718001.1 DUF2199 domain-containing protein [Noviherbaspirillum sp. CPCC 100848]
MSETQSFVCETCGQEHVGLPTDYGFRLPDAIHELEYLSRYLRSRSNPDLCTLDESRYFIRGVLPLPFQEDEGNFNWGAWVEVSREDHDRYVAAFEVDGRGIPRFAGRIANQLPGYETAIGLIVDVQLQDEGQRPTFHVTSGTSHPLKQEQDFGISRKRHHDILEATGFFDADDDI